MLTAKRSSVLANPYVPKLDRRRICSLLITIQIRKYKVNVKKVTVVKKKNSSLEHRLAFLPCLSNCHYLIQSNTCTFPLHIPAFERFFLLLDRADRGRLLFLAGGVVVPLLLWVLEVAALALLHNLRFTGPVLNVLARYDRYNSKCP